MKARRESVTATIALAICLMLASAWTARISANASPMVIHVPADYTKIQWAVGNASAGSTIFVSTGIYYEHLTIDKTLELYGENQGAIIDGNGTGDVIRVLASGVTLGGFVVRNSGTSFWDSGIHLSNSDNSNVSNNTIVSNGHGIWLDGSNQSIVTYNNVSNNQCGIGLSYCYNDIVAGNNVSSSDECGIGLDYSGNNTITGNVVLGNGYGIWITHVGGNTVFRNDITGNARQTDCINSTNAWDKDGMGNYWSDCNSTDADSDGIGDNPYQVDLNNTDHYPLMQAIVVPEFPPNVFLLLLSALTLAVVFLLRRNFTFLQV
jgi:parallel beta-helix repeat protein